MICIQLCYPSLFRKPGKIMCHWQDHKTWWSVTEMPVHPFHTPVCWNCRMPGGERMAPAMKSLTTHCMSPYRCFKKPAVHFGTNKFMSSADRMELEYSQLFLHCPAPLQTEILCPSGANLMAESKRLEPQNIIHVINSAWMSHQHSCSTFTNWGRISMQHLPATSRIILSSVSWVISVSNPIFRESPVTALPRAL